MLRLLVLAYPAIFLTSCAPTRVGDGDFRASAAASPRGGEVSYILAPHFTAGALDAVEVAMTFAGDEDGETVVELPDEFAGQKELWRHLSDLRVTGATVTERDPFTHVLRHPAGAPITIRYRVGSAYDASPAAYAKGGAIIRPDWFASFGEALFSSVEGRGDAPARFEWQGWPASWQRVSDLDHGRLGQAMTGDDIGESTLLVGPDVRVFERPVPNGTLRLGLHGTFQFDIDTYVDDLTQVIAAQRGFWGDASGPYTVTLYALQGIAAGSSAGGTGRSDGFALEATPDIDRSDLTRILAHEHTHTWIPRRVGELPKEDEALSYWFSEGVTEFYTGRTLASTGIWTAGRFVDDLNETLARYAGSPALDLPNAAIAERFWSDSDVQQLPYDRGRLFAYLIDSRLRSASGGSVDYDDLLTVMRDRWRAAPVGGKPGLRPAFVAAAGQLGLDVAPLLERHIDRGEPILLPAGLFGTCAEVRTIRLAAFEPGFDRAKSSETGVIQGVVPDSPAARAGLRNGMVRVDYVSSTEGDSRGPMAYRVSDAAGERVISWLPAGERMFTAQEVVLTGSADAEGCVGKFGGAGT